MRQIDETSRPAAHTSLDAEASVDLTDGGFLEVHSHAHAWQIRRAFLLARRALLNLRLREVSKAIVQIRSLLAVGDPALRVRYEDALLELRACVLVAEDDLPRARELLLAAPQAAAAGTLSTILLRYIDWMSGARTELPEQMSLQAPAPSTHGPWLVRILDLCLNAALEFEHVRPTVAANLAAEALRLATERYGATSPASSLPAVLLAQVAYEQGRLAEAECLIRSRAATIRATGVLECVLRANIVLARLAMHQGRNDEAFACLRDAETIGRIRGWPRLTHAAKAEHARILMLTVHKTTREASSQHASGSNSVSHAPIQDLDTSPRYSSMVAALARATSASLPLHADDRYRILISCLRIGATRGLYRLFVDAGAPLLRLLKNLAHCPQLLEEQSFDLGPYISLLLRATAPSAARSPHSSTSAHPPLSRRETAILRMIAQGMSNKRIAQALGIAPETVKSHAKSILLKLGTRTRAQAVARVASMDLS